MPRHHRTALTNPVLKSPHRGAVRHVGGVGQTAEALVAHPIEQLVLHLFVRQVVQALQHQDPHHGLGRIWRAPTLCTYRARRHTIYLGRQCREVDMGFDLGQWIPQRIDFPAVVLVGKQISLDDATWFHRCKLPSSGCLNFTKDECVNEWGRRGFRRAPMCKQCLLRYQAI